VIVHNRHVKRLAGFGAFGGAWEDWCDAQVANGRLPASKLGPCKAWAPHCGAPYTAWGSTCRGIPYLGENQSFWAKTAIAASAIETGIAAIFTLGLSTIPTGGPAALVDTAREGVKGVIGMATTAGAEFQKIKDEISPPVAEEAAPIYGPVKAGFFGGNMGLFLLGSAALGAVALAVEASGKKKKRRGKR
jgi:hypothetical protein